MRPTSPQWFESVRRRRLLPRLRRELAAHRIYGRRLDVAFEHIRLAEAMNVGRHRATGVERRIGLAHVTAHLWIGFRHRLVLSVTRHLRRLGVISHRLVLLIAYHVGRFSVISRRLAVIAVVTYRLLLTIVAHWFILAVVPHG